MEMGVSRYFWQSALLLSGLLIAACSAPPVFKTHSVEFQGGISLDDQFSLMFYDLIEESRCPTDVECIQPGRVVVSLMPVYYDVFGGEIHLGLDPGNPDLAETVVSDDYRVELIAVDPQPISTRTIDLEDYIVKIQVEKL